MAPTLNISLFVFVSSLILPNVVISSSNSNMEIKSWCSKTPNPQPCEYFMSNNPKYRVPIKGKSDFLKLSIKLALDRCVHAQGKVNDLGFKCRNEQEKAAWLDCVELYENTIHQINKTIDPSTKCTTEDAQTYLSTALTNLDTCHDGFVDLGVTDYVLPLVTSLSNNVSLLLSNTLALNQGASINNRGGASTSNKDEFPTWVRPGTLKLLHSSRPQANVVVAKDGSGNFRTVSAAVAAAGKPSRMYVIHVKHGVYRENVNIAAKNIMLLGDGIGKTVITGSKYAKGSTTKYKTATVAVTGENFIARGITFQNTAGANHHQAVAFRSDSDHSVFHQCSFEGYQDTLYVHSGKQFYRDCDIYGTVDSIFGNADVVFRKCNIYLKWKGYHV